MVSLRDSIPAELQSRLLRELGREESLRHLWPSVVGRKLASNTRPIRLRSGTLVVSVTDGAWQRSLGTVEALIVEAVNRFCGEGACRSIEFREEPAAAKSGRVPGARMRKPAPLPTPDPRAPNCKDLAVAAIGDDGLRKMFLASAQKYLGRQKEFSQ